MQRIHVVAKQGAHPLLHARRALDVGAAELLQRIDEHDHLGVRLLAPAHEVHDLVADRVRLLHEEGDVRAELLLHALLERRVGDERRLQGRLEPVHAGFEPQLVDAHAHALREEPLQALPKRLAGGIGRVGLGHGVGERVHGGEQKVGDRDRLRPVDVVERVRAERDDAALLQLALEPA